MGNLNSKRPIKDTQTLDILQKYFDILILESNFLGVFYECHDITPDDLHKLCVYLHITSKNHGLPFSLDYEKSCFKLRFNTDQLYALRYYYNRNISCFCDRWYSDEEFKNGPLLFLCLADRQLMDGNDLNYFINKCILFILCTTRTSNIIQLHRPLLRTIINILSKKMFFKGDEIIFPIY